MQTVCGAAGVTAEWSIRVETGGMTEV